MHTCEVCGSEIDDYTGGLLCSEKCQDEFDASMFGIDEAQEALNYLQKLQKEYNNG